MPSAAQPIWQQRFGVKQVSIVLVSALVGLTVGLGLYTFVYARGYAYLTNNPQACANCHVMHGILRCLDQVAPPRGSGLQRLSHAPTISPASTLTKIENGFFHSLAFTSGRFPDNIFIRSRDERVTEIHLPQLPRTNHHRHRRPASASNTISCIRCHFDVGHSAASYVVSSPEASPVQSNSLESNSNGEQH